MTTNTAAASAVGPPPGMKVRLSSNESPFGPPAEAIDAAHAMLVEGHRYPDDGSIALREAIAHHEACAVDQVAVGVGSAAVLMDAVAHVAGAGDEVLAFERAFVVYRLGAANVGARYVEAPTAGPATHGTPGYRRDVDAMLAHIGPATRVVAIDNPGNPTGAFLSGDELRALVEGVPDDVLVIVDEAYHHFATGDEGYATVDELGLEHPKLITVRTFSKAYAMAGLRVGYVTGPSGLVGELDARRTRFNVSSPAQAAAIASLAAVGHVERTVDVTIRGRARMAAMLDELGVPYTAGVGNFVTIELGTDAAAIVEDYARHGVGVRELAPYGMREQIRVSVGTDEEVDTFLEVSTQVLDSVPSRR